MIMIAVKTDFYPLACEKFTALKFVLVTTQIYLETFHRNVFRHMISTAI